MDAILTPEQMYKIDNYFINTIGISSAILMENAAHSSAAIIKNIIPIKYDDLGLSPITNIIIVCGSGNNGGDGFAIARHLKQDYNVRVVWIGSKDKMSDETKNNFNLLEKLEIEISHIQNKNDLDKLHCNKNTYLIDALFGIGANENLRGIVVDILERLKDGKEFIAIDTPTGLNTLSGNTHQYTLNCSHTITMFAPKIGMFINNGPNKCGKIHIANLGVPSRDALILNYIYTFTSPDYTFAEMALNNKNTSKFDYGRVVIIASSEQYPGAGTLAANACISSGAGLVHLVTNDYNSLLLPEIIPYKFKITEDKKDKIADNDINEIKKLIDKADTIVFGCGIGNNLVFTELFDYFIRLKNKKIIIDADGLKYIDVNKKYNKNVLLTPHIGEYSKLIKTSIEKINEDRLLSVKTNAKKMNLNILLKGVGTIITDGKITYISSSGNNGLSTAGSGDVLVGMLAATLSNENNIPLYACITAHSHGKIAENYSKKYAQKTLTASQMIDEIKFLGKNANK